MRDLKTTSNAQLGFGKSFGQSNATQIQKHPEQAPREGTSQRGSACEWQKPHRGFRFAPTASLSVRSSVKICYGLHQCALQRTELALSEETGTDVLQKILRNWTFWVCAGMFHQAEQIPLQLPTNIRQNWGKRGAKATRTKGEWPSRSRGPLGHVDVQKNPRTPSRQKKHPLRRSKAKVRFPPRFLAGTRSGSHPGTSQNGAVAFGFPFGLPNFLSLKTRWSHWSRGFGLTSHALAQQAWKPFCDTVLVDSNASSLITSEGESSKTTPNFHLRKCF